MFWTVTQSLLSGLGAATQLFALTLLFGLPLGLVIAFGSMSKWTPFRFLLQPKKGKKSEEPGQAAAERDLSDNLALTEEESGLADKREPSKFVKALASFRPVHALTDIVVWVVRGTPLMLQLMIIYYGPGLWFDNNIWGGDGRMTASVVAFVINYACYFSVIYRGGIQGVPVGQREAAQVLGFTRRQIFFKITLLQMIKRIVPPMSNEIITLVKDTSLARIIAVTELIKAGESFMKSSGIIWPLFYTGVFYLIFVGILTILFNFIERKLSYFR
ncbi:MAG: amino acid ABC transporter permease [Clostridiales bacterium]|nr:amino acid ABC transporter permease [Clostridiales bacterium]